MIIRAVALLTMVWVENAPSGYGYGVWKQEYSDTHPVQEVKVVEHNTVQVRLKWDTPTRFRVTPMWLGLDSYDLSKSEWSEWYLWNYPKLQIASADSKHIVLMWNSAITPPVSLYYSSDMKTWHLLATTNGSLYIDYNAILLNKKKFYRLRK